MNETERCFYYLKGCSGIKTNDSIQGLGCYKRNHSWSSQNSCWHNEDMVIIEKIEAKDW